MNKNNRGSPAKAFKAFCQWPEGVTILIADAYDDWMKESSKATFHLGEFLEKKNLVNQDKDFVFMARFPKLTQQFWDEKLIASIERGIVWQLGFEGFELRRSQAFVVDQPCSEPFLWFLYVY